MDCDKKKEFFCALKTSNKYNCLVLLLLLAYLQLLPLFRVHHRPGNLLYVHRCNVVIVASFFAHFNFFENPREFFAECLNVIWAGNAKKIQWKITKKNLFWNWTLSNTGPALPCSTSRNRTNSRWWRIFFSSQRPLLAPNRPSPQPPMRHTIQGFGSTQPHQGIWTGHAAVGKCQQRLTTSGIIKILIWKKFFLIIFICHLADVAAHVFCTKRFAAQSARRAKMRYRYMRQRPLGNGTFPSIHTRNPLCIHHSCTGEKFSRIRKEKYQSDCWCAFSNVKTLV